MTNQHSFVSSDRFDRDLYTSSKTAERVLNGAIVGAEISESFEEYLEIFEAFYSDDIEVSGGTQTEPIRGKARVRSLIFNFLVPLHVMAEVGGLSVSIRETAIPGDAADETNSAWTLDLVGASGATCALRWCTHRWARSRVRYERHYDYQQSGGPLTQDDLSFNTSKAVAGIRRPSYYVPTERQIMSRNDDRLQFSDEWNRREEHGIGLVRRNRSGVYSPETRAE